MAELKPCPFCGGEARIGVKLAIFSMDVYDEDYYVFCTECAVHTIECEDDEVATEVWNRRVNNG